MDASEALEILARGTTSDPNTSREVRRAAIGGAHESPNPPFELFDAAKGEPESLSQAIQLAVGSASMSWTNIGHLNANAGVFDDQHALAVSSQLQAYIEERTKTLLFQYSEWLDGQSLMVGFEQWSREQQVTVEDDRTHEQLVADFLVSDAYDRSIYGNNSNRVDGD